MFFFIRLAEAGLENIESQVNELDSDMQKSIFRALCILTKNNMSSIIDMISSGTLRIGTYLNSPVPDFLITLHFGNKSIATALDKAIKIVVLSNILVLSKDKLKNSISDQNYFAGTKNSEPLLSGMYKNDSSISNDDYNNTVDPLYREYIGLYLRHGGR